MKAIDTNVLIRFLMKDDERQSEAVYLIFKDAEEKRQELWVPLVVILETLWVLDSAYDIPRPEIVDTIDTLLQMPVLKFETQPALQQFVNLARDTNLDLSDLLIAVSAKYSGADRILTFDAKASRLNFFEMIRINS